MKWLLTLLLILTVAVMFTLSAVIDPGFVVIGHGGWTIDTTLSLFIIVLVMGGFLLYHLLRLLIALWRLPSRFGKKNVWQLQQQAQTSLLRGVLASLERDWQTAEHAFLKVVSPNELSILHYLGASYAASQQRDNSRVMVYLNEEAVKGTPEKFAMTLFTAQLHWQQQNLPAALQNTLQARSLAPKNENLMMLLALYLQLADWPALLELLPEIRKRKALPVEPIQRLENRASVALIQYTLRTNPKQAANWWSQIPKAIRLRPVVLKVYIQHLIAAGEMTAAESLLKEALKYHWDADLITLYGEVETTHLSSQISYAEGLLKGHEKDPVLLLMLGRLCMRNQLWGKAQQYLEASSHIVPHPVTYQVLGDLYTQLGEQGKAGEYYRRGLSLALETP
jgi:HemY protein